MAVSAPNLHIHRKTVTKIPNSGCLQRLRFFFFFFGRAFLWLWALFSRFCALFTEPTNLFFNKIFIKNESHSTIHTFKNYFIIVFSIFTKIRVSKHTFNLYLNLTIPHLLLSIYLFIFYFCVYLKRYSYSVYSSSFF